VISTSEVREVGRRVLVTGAHGFVGRTLTAELIRRGFTVVAAVREASQAGQLADGVLPLVVGDLSRDPIPSFVTDTAIHLAGRAHRLGDRQSNVGDYSFANITATERVLAASIESGASSFVFVSTAKVLGEHSHAPLAESAARDPQDAYATSKAVAEQLVLDAASESLRTCVIRPPLVHGAGARANVARLVSLVRLGAVIPLPFDAVRNQRSLVSVENLSAALILCASDTRAHGIYHVTDGEPLSTADIIREVAAGLGRKVRMSAIPVKVLEQLGRAFGFSGEVERLTGSLVLDDNRIRRSLGWKPLFCTREGLRRTAASFIRMGNR
jgi:nucleoside-diphosphate-sugar epimerase